MCLVGLRRNEATLDADVYLDGLPDRIDGAHVVVCDPMLATGGSLIQVADMLDGAGRGDVTALCLIASVPGVERFCAAHPTARVVAAALDDTLNDVGYIVPGLGDAGDRLLRAAAALTDCAAACGAAPSVRHARARRTGPTYRATVGSQVVDLPIVALDDELAIALLITVDLGVAFCERPAPSSSSAWAGSASRSSPRSPPWGSRWPSRSPGGSASTST